MHIYNVHKYFSENNYLPGDMLDLFGIVSKKPQIILKVQKLLLGVFEK